MKFKIDKEKKDAVEKNPKITLYLKEEDGSVILKGREESGMEKFIMNFRRGRFYRNASASLEGLETDEKGRIKEDSSY